MSTPEEDIEVALFTKAIEYTDLLLVFPNESLPPPSNLTAYVVVTHFRNGSTSYALSGSGCDLNVGILQMCVYAPRDKGANEARKRAGDIAALFWTPENLSLSQNSTRVRVTKRPVLGTAVPTDTAFMLPVSIYYEVFI